MHTTNTGRDRAAKMLSAIGLALGYLLVFVPLAVAWLVYA